MRRYVWTRLAKQLDRGVGSPVARSIISALIIVALFWNAGLAHHVLMSIRVVNGTQHFINLAILLVVIIGSGQKGCFVPRLRIKVKVKLIQKPSFSVP